MNTKFTVWHYTRLNLASVGGVEQHIRGLKDAMESLGHHVHVGISSAVPMHSAEEHGRVVIHTHGDSWPSPALLFSRFRSPSARVYWIHVCHGNALERVLACREYASFSGWKGVLRDVSLLKLSDAAVAVSAHALEETRGYYFFRGPSRVIANGADTSVFKPLERVESAPRLIFLGRLEDRVKNAHMLLQACVTVHARHPDFELLLAPGIETTHPYVKNLGKLAPPALASALARSRALVLTSLYEGDPLVLREAMAMGLPVVASDIAAVRETLGAYAGAALFNPRDVASLVDAIERVLYGAIPNPTPAPRGWDTVAREYVGFYESLF